MEKNENGFPTMMVGNRHAQGGCPGFCGGSADGCPGFCSCSNGNNGNAGNGGNGNGTSGGMNHACGGRGDCLDHVPLAYVYAPDQAFRMLYSAEDALKHGTLFEELYKPMEVYGRE